MSSIKKQGLLKEMLEHDESSPLYMKDLSPEELENWKDRLLAILPLDDEEEQELRSCFASLVEKATRDVDS